MEDRKDTIEFVEKYKELSPEYKKLTSMLLEALVNVQRKESSNVENAISEIMKIAEQLPLEHQEKVLEVIKTIKTREEEALNENI